MVIRSRSASLMTKNSFMPVAIPRPAFVPELAEAAKDRKTFDALAKKSGSKGGELTLKRKSNVPAPVAKAVFAAARTARPSGLVRG